MSLRTLKKKAQELQRRIGQSMSDSGRPNGKCKGLQRKLARVQKIRRKIKRRRW